MKKIVTIAAIVMSLSLLAGCYQTTVRTGLAPSGIKKSIWSTHFINGLTASEVDAQSHCGDAGVSAVTHKISFIDHIIGGITFMIFTPSTIEIECAAKR